MKNSNPFLPSKIHNPKFFCNRDEEVNILIKEISENRNILIVSDKGIGKTKLISHLFFILSQSGKYNTLYYNIDISNSLDNLVAELVIKIIDSLPKKVVKNRFDNYRTDQDGKKVLKLPDESSPEEILGRAITELEKLNQKTIIAIDGCDICIHLGKEKFEKMILGPFSSLKQVSLIITATKKFLLPMNCRQLYLDKIDESVYKKFIRDIFKNSGRTITKRTVNNIIDWSKLNTEIVQLVCSRLWQLKKKKIRMNDLESIIDGLMVEVKIYYSHISNLLSPYQLKLLRAIAIQNDPFQVTSSSFINEYRLNAPSSVKTALKALTEKNLIYREGNNYLLKDILLNNWINHKNNSI